jgi:hypothetical protein
MLNRQAIQIVEILGPSDQGKSRPYKCTGADDAIYYVKGRQTNRASLWNEWICGHLALNFGLQVPEFGLVDVTEELLAETPKEWRDIGVGLAFGSRLHPNTIWMEVSLLSEVPVQVQRDVLVFDWWVRNGDRLTGNTNLLWDVSNKELVVIDHNLAFDHDFSTTEFLENHVFSAQWPFVCSDMMVQAEYLQRLCNALEALTIACHNAPPEWHWANIENDVPSNFDLDYVHKTLSRCKTHELWRSV